MSLKIYSYSPDQHSPEYIRGLRAGKEATGRDWAIWRKKYIDLIDEHKSKINKLKDIISKMVDQHNKQIADLQRTIAEKDAQIIDLESHVEALKIAFKHRREG